MNCDGPITPHDLSDSMTSAELVGTFHRLPPEIQENFQRWVHRATTTESHWRRIGALVLALRSGLLDETLGPEMQDVPEALKA